jgi:hypothetical protein
VAEQQQKSAEDLPPIAVSSSSQGKSLAKLLYLDEMATLQQLHRRQEHTPDTTKR